MPRDILNIEIEKKESPPSTIGGRSLALPEAIKEISERLRQAKQPVLIAGVHISRLAVLDKVLALVNNLNIPVVTSILGKSSFPESHPCFIGNYFGQFGDPQVKEYVESGDLIVCLGAVLTEMETGGYSANLPPEKLIIANNHELSIGRHSYPHIDFAMLVNDLLAITTNGALKGKKFSVPKINLERLDPHPEHSALTVAAMLTELNNMLDDRFRVVSDTGDCLYAGFSLKTDSFIAPGYYSSMGFGVPAGIGAQLADPKKRSVILVGDGGFQMTGCELATAVKLGLNPIIILFNNASYAMMRFIDQKRDYFDLSCWNYVALAKALGAIGLSAQNKSDFQKALKYAQASEVPVLIDCSLSETDISPTLKRLTDHFGQKLRAAAS